MNVLLLPLARRWGEFSHIPLSALFLNTSKQITHVHKLTVLPTQISFPHCQYLFSSTFHQKIMHPPTNMGVGGNSNLKQPLLTLFYLHWLQNSPNLKYDVR
jgi:hypothetical protein